MVKTFFIILEFHNIDPEVGRFRPAMIRSNVDLPEPFFPVSKRASPGLSSKSRLAKTNLSPRLAVRFNPDQIDNDWSSMINLLPKKNGAGELHFTFL